VISCPVCSQAGNTQYYICKDMIIYKCPACGMMFQDPARKPFNDSALIEKIYAEYIQEFDSHRGLNTARLKRIESLVNKPLSGRKILEIGVGTGLLASLLMGQGASYQGIEPSAVCYENIVTRFPALKGNVLNKFYEEGDFNPGSFDVIIMVDTLEHIPYPVDFLKKIKKCLSPGGLLYLEVPNESLLKYKAFLRRRFKMYYGYPTNPEHANLFTLSTIQKTLARAGFKTEVLFQATIWGDQQRMNIALGAANRWWLKVACSFFRITKIDLMLQQGVIISLSGPVQ
jgi:2-polyprenyl-3-methyl-5-hydroxy-6-metoxy-1,4-benzoquinol methylase